MWCLIFWFDKNSFSEKEEWACAGRKAHQSIWTNTARAVRCIWNVMSALYVDSHHRPPFTTGKACSACWLKQHWILGNIGLFSLNNICQLVKLKCPASQGHTLKKTSFSYLSTTTLLLTHKGTFCKVLRRSFRVFTRKHLSILHFMKVQRSKFVGSVLDVKC